MADNTRPMPYQHPDPIDGPIGQDLCGITPEEVARFKAPEPIELQAEAVAQPPADGDPFTMHPPHVWAKAMAMPDSAVWENASETTPPVIVDH